MIIDSDKLASRVSSYGVARQYSDTGRYAFVHGNLLFRSAFIQEPDATIAEAFVSQCHLIDDLSVMASEAAGHLAECGVGQLYMVPQVHWEHELHDHCPHVWQRVFNCLGLAIDDTRLTGGNAIFLTPGKVPLAEIFIELLQGLTQASVMFLAEMPLIVKIHHHRQIWLSSTDSNLMLKPIGH